MAATSDLHGLGANEGPPVKYTWTPPSLLPQLLPWLAVLVLLILKPNRAAEAWWIWVPLVCAAGLEIALRSLLDFIPSEVLDILGRAFNSLAFGIAALWLLTPQLGSRSRFLVFLKMLLAAGAVSAFAFLARQDWEQGASAIGFLVLMGVCVVVAVGALSLAGLLCRRRYRPLVLSLWLIAFVLALWLAISTPFSLIAMLNGGGGPWLEFLTGVVSIAAVTFLVLLPFLVLSFANDWYRERLKQLLWPEGAKPPPVISPAAASAPAT